MADAGWCWVLLAGDGCCWVMLDAVFQHCLRAFLRAFLFCSSTFRVRIPTVFRHCLTRKMTQEQHIMRAFVLHFLAFVLHLYYACICIMRAFVLHLYQHWITQPKTLWNQDKHTHTYAHIHTCTRTPTQQLCISACRTHIQLCISTCRTHIQLVHPGEPKMPPKSIQPSNKFADITCGFMYVLLCFGVGLKILSLPPVHKG